jgi:hypothetical protein
MAQKILENKFSVTYQTDAEGNVKTNDYISEAQLEKLTKDQAEVKPTPLAAPEVTKRQAYQITLAETLDEFATLFPKRALEFANYGAKLAQQNVMRDMQRDAEIAEQDGVVDLLPLVQEPNVREKATPQSAAEKALMRLAKEAGKEVDIEQVRAILAQFAQPAA